MSFSLKSEEIKEPDLNAKSFDASYTRKSELNVYSKPVAQKNAKDGLVQFVSCKLNMFYIFFSAMYKIMNTPKLPTFILKRMNRLG